MIMNIYNDSLYGVRLSNEEIKKGRINKQSLSNMIDMVLCNAISEDEGFIYDLLDTIDNQNREYVYSLTDEELANKYIDTFADVDECEIKTIEDREKIQDDLIDSMGGDTRDYYQYFIVSESGRDIIKKFFPRETIVYYERLDIYVWCIGHYGMSWTMFYSDKKISEI